MSLKSFLKEGLSSSKLKTALDVLRKEQKNVYKLIQDLSLINVIDEIVISPKRVEIIMDYVDLENSDCVIIGKYKKKVRIMAGKRTDSIRLLIDKD